MTAFEDIEDAIADSAAMVTINWSERYSVFRAKTVEEMIQAFCVAWADRQVQSEIVTCARQKAFCMSRDIKQRAKTGDYGLSESGMFEVPTLHKWTLDIPKPMIATNKSAAKNFWPERLEFLFQFPATFNGKIQKSRLHEQIGGAS
jgi:naphthoate synthase